MGETFKIAFSSSWPLIVTLVAVFCIIIFNILIYRRTVPESQLITRTILLTIRSCALILILLTLTGTTINITRSSFKKPRVALLIDKSGSMEIVDKKEKRADIISRALHSKIFKGLQDRYNMVLYYFSDRLTPAKKFPPDSIKPEGLATNISGAITDLLEKETALSAIILITDGSYNRGKNPVRTAEKIEIPIYTLGVGNPLQRRDLVLSQMRTNEIVYVNDLVPVELLINGPGFEGEEVYVRLFVENKIIATKSITIPQEGLPKNITLYFKPEREGFLELACDITRLKGEASYKNNQRKCYVRVLKNKISLLFISGAPCADLSFLKRILLKDKNIRVTIRTQKQGNTFYEGKLPSLMDLSSFDCLILLNFPRSDTDHQLWKNLSREIKKLKKPLFILTGSETDFKRVRSIGELLPVTGLKKSYEKIILPELTQEGKNHPIMKVFEDQEKTTQAWKDLPPLYTSWIVDNIKPESVVLLNSKFRVTQNPSKEIKQPLVVIRSLNTEKSVLFIGQGIYRWDLLMWGLGKTNNLLRSFITNIIRWLAIRETNSLSHLSLDKNIYRAGEEIKFYARVYDETYKVLTNAHVEVTIVSGSDTVSINLTESESGKYSGSYRTFKSGKYISIMKATHDRFTLASDTVEFSVSEYNPEFMDTRADFKTLKQIAAVTGGRFTAFDSLSAIAREMNIPRLRETNSHQLKLFETFPFALFVMILFFAEWTIRRRKGMI